MGTDQVYDPVSLNQNKAERREQETETKCSFVNACSFVYCHNQCISIFRHIAWAENVCFRIFSFTHCCIQPCVLFRLMNLCDFYGMSSLSPKKIGADKISCVVFPNSAILASLYCRSSKPVEGAILLKQVAKRLRLFSNSSYQNHTH